MNGLDADTLALVIETLRKFAGRRLAPEFLLGLDETETFPAEILKELYDPATLGLHLLFIPEEYGGMGAGVADLCQVAELLAGIDLGVATAVLATFLGTDPIKVGGTPEQKRLWLGRVAGEALLMAYAATEPQAGSDLAALTTRAEPVIIDGRVSAYRITGRKQWISNGGVADLYSVLALAPGGPSWFVVERGAPGFTAGKPERKHGIRASNTAALFLDEVLVPAGNLVGEVEGQGLAQAQAVFGYTRLMVGAFGLGAGWEALRRAIAYSRERVQAGAPLSQKPGYTHKLIAPNAARLEAARAYIDWVAARLDSGEPGLATEGAVAKYLATEAGLRAADDAIQALGGYGYTREYLVEKIRRDVRITTIYEGTSEIMEWTIARDRWQIHLKTRGQHYLDWAGRLEALHPERPENGLATAALGLRALAALIERSRIDRLTRSQHILFRLGEWIALGEAAAVFAESAGGPVAASVPLDVPARQALSRIFARQAALRLASEGLAWVGGALPPGAPAADLAAAVQYLPILQAQSGLLADMDCAVGMIYG